VRCATRGARLGLRLGRLEFNEHAPAAHDQFEAKDDHAQEQPQEQKSGAKGDHAQEQKPDAKGDHVQEQPEANNKSAQKQKPDAKGEHVQKQKPGVKDEHARTGLMAEFKADLNKTFDANKTVSHVLDTIGEKTHLGREKINVGVAGFLAVLVALELLFGSNGGFVCNVLIGTLYPSIASLRALHDESGRTHMLAYWPLFGISLLFDPLSSWVTGYFLIKAVALLALALPQVAGAEAVYTRALEPMLAHWYSSPEKDE
jgi:hypothetical protein